MPAAGSSPTSFMQQQCSDKAGATMAATTKVQQRQWQQNWRHNNGNNKAGTTMAANTTNHQ
jgi:hypothetical protein